MAVKTVILGAAGRMGKTLIRCLAEEKVPGLELAGAVDLWDVPELGTDAGRIAGTRETGIQLINNLAEVAQQAEVVVDFSSHHGTAGNALRMAEWGAAWVIGTTGLGPDELAAVRKAAEKIPVVMSGNMSLGINLLCRLVEEGARALKGKGYDVEVLERHHRLKKDAPSGTALMLGRAAAAGCGWELDAVQCDGRSGQVGERRDREIGFHSVRGGDIVGDHTVLLAGTGELLELSHRATSRDVFAIGALQAALWAAGREPGLYSMRDVLGFE